MQETNRNEIKKFEKRNRVHFKDYFLMIFTSLIFDSIQALFSTIPILGWALSSLVSLFAWLTFYVWTSIKGWGLSDTVKQMAVQYFIPLIEVVPLINILPTWTLRVVIQLSFLKAEDVVYNASGGRADIEKLVDVYKKVA